MQICALHNKYAFYASFVTEIFELSKKLTVYTCILLRDEAIIFLNNAIVLFVELSPFNYLVGVYK